MFMKNLFNFLMPALCAFALNAQAQTSDFVELIPSPYLQKDLTASAGLGIVTLPKYADGSEQKISPLPFLDLEWKSGVFFSTVSGFGFNFSQNPSWQYGVRLGLIAYQEQSAKNRDNGPGNTPTDLAPAVFGNYLIDQHFTVLSSIQAGAGVRRESQAFWVSLGGRYVDRLDASNRIYGVLSTSWASLHYMQDYYGVNQMQAADYKFSEYDARAGMLKLKLAVGVDTVLNQNWSLLTGLSLTHPLGAAASSPLSSNKTQVLAYSALYYRF
ncbi:outer membrane protein [Oxalobacteraceae bacterium GrIS 1.18]